MSKDFAKSFAMQGFTDITHSTKAHQFRNLSETEKLVGQQKENTVSVRKKML